MLFRALRPKSAFGNKFCDFWGQPAPKSADGGSLNIFTLCLVSWALGPCGALEILDKPQGVLGDALGEPLETALGLGHLVHPCHGGLDPGLLGIRWPVEPPKPFGTTERINADETLPTLDPGSKVRKLEGRSDT